jgi:hypothetical protein
MPIESNWYTLFEGSGSATGNGWLEEVCYLGEEQWMLSLRDDPLWSTIDVEIQEPENHSSASLAGWVIDMDSTDNDDGYTRVRALLEIAEEVGAAACQHLLQQFINDFESED